MHNDKDRFRTSSGRTDLGVLGLKKAKVQVISLLIFPEYHESMRIQWELSTTAQEYNAGITTQVPVRTSVRLKSRYRGTLSFGKRKLIVEKKINAR